MGQIGRCNEWGQFAISRSEKLNWMTTSWNVPFLSAPILRKVDQALSKRNFVFKKFSNFFNVFGKKSSKRDTTYSYRPNLFEQSCRFHRPHRKTDLVGKTESITHNGEKTVSMKFLLLPEEFENACVNTFVRFQLLSLNVNFQFLLFPDLLICLNRNWYINDNRNTLAHIPLKISIKWTLNKKSSDV